MWNQPRLMLATADALTIVGGVILMAAAGLWLMRQPILPIRRVAVINELREVRGADLEQALQGVRGNLLTVSLDSVKASLEKLPWVRRVDLRRRWPGTLELLIYEQRAVARWGDATQQLVNAEGEVFFAPNVTSSAILPVFHGPLGTSPEILARYREFDAVLGTAERRVNQVRLTHRLAWQVRLDNGLWLELGRDQQKSPVRERLARFAAAYANGIIPEPSRHLVADLRYPNGFVLRNTGGEPVAGEVRSTS